MAPPPRKDRQLIAEGYAAGRSVQWLAREFGTTSSAVYQLVYRMGVKRPVSPGSGVVGRTKRERDSDIASRLAVLLGERPRPEAPRRRIPDVDLLRYAGAGPEGWLAAPTGLLRASDRLEDALVPTGLSDASWEALGAYIERPPDVPEEWALECFRRANGFVGFLWEVLDLAPQPHQVAMAWVMLAARDAVFVLGRQSGKDWAAAAFLTWEAITRPNSRTVVISEAQRQSDDLADTVRGFIARSPEATDAVDERRCNRETLRFLNSSAIWFLPAEGAIRGKSAITRVIVNEAVAVPQEAFAAVTPMLATKHGQLALLSTPGGRHGPMYEYYNKESSATMRLPSSVNRHISPDFLEAQKDRLDADTFRREHLAEFSDVKGSYFNSQTIDDATVKYTMRDAHEPDKTYVIGYDPGLVSDSGVITVLSVDADKHRRVEAIRAFTGVPWPVQQQHLIELIRTFNPVLVLIEGNGLGKPIIQDMQANGFHIVQEFTSTQDSKLQAYGYLKGLLERRHLTLPASERRLLIELKLFQYKISPAGNVGLHHISGQGDDYADSLCFAAWALRNAEGADVGLVVDRDDPRDPGSRLSLRDPSVSPFGGSWRTR